MPPLPPRAEDVATIDGIVRALYETISGPPGPRDWDRLRSLFLAGARLLKASVQPGHAFVLTPMDMGSFIALARARFEHEAQGFYERETSRKTESFGQIAHVFSTYEARHEASDAEPFARGVNSAQLFHDGARWWVVNIMWDDERQKPG